MAKEMKPTSGSTTAAGAPAADTHPARWRTLTLLATAELLGMSLWFSASSVAPQLQARWDLSAGQVGLLTTLVQFGFVAGTATSALLNLADIIPARRLFAVSALLGALSNAALVWAPGFGGALVSRFAVGFFLAGVYPPAMKMAATWFRSGRGLAIGTVVGALTAGKAVPYLLEGSGQLSLSGAILIPSGAALMAGVLVALMYHDGPYAFPTRPFSWRMVADVIRVPELRRITGGYFGHMWELYALWTWIPGFLAASFAADSGPKATHGHAALWSSAVIGIGALGAIAGGWAADRVGRPRVVRLALLGSGACALASPWLFGAPRWLLLAVCLFWGIAVIADSAQFSALVTEAAPPHAVGTALTLQTSLGFLLTIGSIQLVPRLAATWGWRWAMVTLTIGPLLGLLSTRRLRRVT